MAIFDKPKEAFIALRPICVLITKEQTVENIQCLQSQLQNIGNGALQELQEYVLFPMRFSLKTPGRKQERFVQSVVECISFIISRTRVKKQQLFHELFSEISLCLSNPGNHGKLANVSEELKMSVVQGLDVLLHSAYGDVILCIYQVEMIPVLGLVISLLLEIAENEKLRQLQVNAMKCLLLLIGQCDCPDSHFSFNIDDLVLVGDSFATFLPGISLAMSRIISGDVKQGHLVTIYAIKVWYKTVGLVMADEHLVKDTCGKKMLSTEQSKLAKLIVNRTPEWVKSTGSKLDILLEKICNCTASNMHWKTRLELIELVNHLLPRCNKSFKESIGRLLEVLVGLIGDERPEVQTRCSQVLRSVSEKCIMSENKAFADVLSENLHSLTTSLPRLMRTLDDQGKLSTLRLLLGYLKLLGYKINVVLNSTAHLRRLSKALLQILEMDVTDVRIVEERRVASEVEPLQSPTELSNSNCLTKWIKPATQRKYFKYFNAEHIFALLQQICRVLGYYGNLYLLVDHFMELYQESVVYRKQAAFVINELLFGAIGIDVEVLSERETSVSIDDLKAIVTSIIEEYTSIENWHLVTSMNSECETSLKTNQPRLEDFASGSHSSYLCSTSQNLTVQDMNSNIWQICIQLEGIGYFAHVLKTEFRLLLMITLYPVLEKAGDETLFISQTAARTLVELCQACDYESLQELINQNSDYLVNTISLNLRRLTQHPHTPCVLSVMFSHSDASLLPLVGDVIQDVLFSLDQYYGERAELFFTVFHSLLAALAHWFGTKDSSQNREPRDKDSAAIAKNCSSSTTVENMQCFFVEYQKQKRLAEGIVDEADLENTACEIPEADNSDDCLDVKKELSAHVQITKDVMERCIHLLSDKSIKLRIKVLDVLELCVTVLQSNENELLPMVHRVWSPLVQRLTNDDPLVVLRAFKVLCKIGDACGKFLTSRISKDVLPKLSKSLVNQAPVSAKAGPIYSHTLSYKLQFTVLQSLGTLCEKLDLAESDLDIVISTCLPYLSSRQPLKLQEAACSVFHHLIEVDPDAVWLALNEAYCPCTYDPPHPSLLPIRLSGTGKQRNEFTDNILQLLQRLQ
uniref:TELO2-interacting protein 1 homolog n=1 Tax=Callorhinchus milii TaxID=7868 RepID=A0A4W3J3F5_CALMI|eukprot:gi/632939507/ref/XP_007910321.1/ PREDICTED: TELO2-interacting protein 1 homolog [Callorhinchus milii]